VGKLRRGQASTEGGRRRTSFERAGFDGGEDKLVDKLREDGGGQARDVRSRWKIKL
jgi:hypothetical protein